MPTTVQSARLENLSYEDLVRWSNLLSDNKVDDYIAAINSAGYEVSEMQAVEDFASGYMDFYVNSEGNYTVTQFKGDYQNVITNPIDSNASTISRGSISQMLNRGKDAVTGKLNISKFPASGSFASQASYVLGSVGSAVSAVSAGVTLGKIIDSTLYNANPDFWDSVGMSSLNPETWNSITNGDDSNFAGLFNLILGLDPETGNSQAYMDENALAYMAYYMAQNGVFDVPITSEATLDDTSMLRYSNIPQPVLFRENVSNFSFVAATSGGAPYIIGKNIKFLENGVDVSNDYYIVTFNNTNVGAYYYWFAIAKNPRASTTYYTLQMVFDEYYIDGTFNRTTQYNQTFVDRSDGSIRTMACSDFSSSSSFILDPNYNISVADLRDSSISSSYIADIWYILKNGTISTGGIDGITNQDGASLPDISSWNDIPSTLSSLKQQYPDLWNNALTWDNVQPDGSNPQLVYVPVATPNATSATDIQPTSGTQTQTQTVVDPATSTQTLLDLITQLATKTQTDTDTSIPPENPTDTGTGDSPVPVPPTGSASALWAVYHPTQAEVNSFGAWLWSTNFVDQLLKVFQNPMDAIISLHKVFISPVDAGTTTIHAGYLDSGVSSDYITQQYVYKDCGYVNCSEEFGNVFDYIGTNISLYLPFIGIVPLNVDEVMRSTIHVTYGCDLFTGAILAQVEVQRDGNTVVMYQYGGDGGVQYPVSGSRSSGFLTGLAATIGAAASVMTGGASLPAIGAAFGGSVMSAQKQVQHSGGFSGNSGAMGGKIPYLIIERPQTKVAKTFPRLAGYPTNYSCKLGDCTNHVVVSHVHVEGINATDTELEQIETLLKDGVLV